MKTAFMAAVAAAISNYDLGSFKHYSSLAACPRHTPNISNRPQPGWRDAQRKRTYAKLAKRIRVNRRNH